MKKNNLILLMLWPLSVFAEENLKSVETFKHICFECHNLREFSTRTRMKRYYWEGKIKQMRTYTTISDDELTLIADYLSKGTYMTDPRLKDPKSADRKKLN